MTSIAIPPIAISVADHDRLAPLAHAAIEDGHPVGYFLWSELRRATICAPADLPRNTVRLNSWVSFRTDWGWPVTSRLLVCPDDYSDESAHLSVLSPVGAALIGLQARSRMPYLGIEGFRHVASAESLDPPVGLMSLLRLPAEADKRNASEDENNDDDPGPSTA